MPLEGGLILEMPSVDQDLAGIPSYDTPGMTIKHSYIFQTWHLYVYIFKINGDIGVAYVNTNKKYAAGYLGTESIDPSLVSYYDYQFLYPTQVILTVKPKGKAVKPLSFPYGMPTNPQYTPFSKLYEVNPDLVRKFVIVSSSYLLFTIKVMLISTYFALSGLIRIPCSLCWQWSSKQCQRGQW